MTEYLIGAVTAALVNDWALSRALDAEGADTLARLNRAGCLGGLTVVVTLIACGLCYPLYYGILSPLGLDAARVPLCFLAAIGYAWGAGRLARSGAGTRAEFVESAWPLTALNAAVLGAAVQGLAAGYGFAGTLLSALAASVTFAVGLAALAAIQARMDVDALPESVRGFPSLLLAAALISMALMAFAGL